MHWHNTISHCRFYVQHSCHSQPNSWGFLILPSNATQKRIVNKLTHILIGLHVSLTFGVVFVLFCPLHVSGWLWLVLCGLSVSVNVCVSFLLGRVNLPWLIQTCWAGLETPPPHSQSVPNCLVKTGDFGAKIGLSKLLPGKKRLPVNVM